MPEHGAPISYLVLQPGTPCFTADDQPVGTVKRILADEEKDIYDGLILDTVDADRACDLYEHGVVLTLTADQLHHLPDPTANPATMGVTPDDTVKHGLGEELGETLRKAWDRISGNY
jgi:hypothetical protein